MVVVQAIIYFFSLIAIEAPYAFFTYGFVSWLAKSIYAALLISCLAGGGYGAHKRRSLHGKIILACSILAWLMLGFFSIVVAG
jgi:hypothetical protein